MFKYHFTCAKCGEPQVNKERISRTIPVHINSEGMSGQTEYEELCDKCYKQVVEILTDWIKEGERTWIEF